MERYATHAVQGLACLGMLAFSRGIGYADVPAGIYLEEIQPGSVLSGAKIPIWLKAEVIKANANDPPGPGLRVRFMIRLKGEKNEGGELIHGDTTTQIKPNFHQIPGKYASIATASKEFSAAPGTYELRAELVHGDNTTRETFGGAKSNWKEFQVGPLNKESLKGVVGPKGCDILDGGIITLPPGAKIEVEPMMILGHEAGKLLKLNHDAVVAIAEAHDKAAAITSALPGVSVYVTGSLLATSLTLTTVDKVGGDRGIYVRVLYISPGSPAVTPWGV